MSFRRMWGIRRAKADSSRKAISIRKKADILPLTFAQRMKSGLEPMHSTPSVRLA
ncbi:MAG: hypothetical protein JXJ17_00495 [Anaerolineae bacterium]|nr:hypothetical protein [Anaerolineae bacterium]